jgi:hypothetical protein
MAQREGISGSAKGSGWSGRQNLGSIARQVGQSSAKGPLARAVEHILPGRRWVSSLHRTTGRGPTGVSHERVGRLLSPSTILVCAKAAGRPTRRFCRFWDRAQSVVIPRERRMASSIQHRGVNPSPVRDVAGDPDGKGAIRRPIPRQCAAGVDEVVHDGASGDRIEKQRNIEAVTECLHKPSTTVRDAVDAGQAVTGQLGRQNIDSAVEIRPRQPGHIHRIEVEDGRIGHFRVIYK